MNYSEAMEYIKNTAKFGMNFGLERVLKILEYLDNPQDKIKCIHVGGTNGKGSTTAMISSILREEGYKVGMYTSPYLEEFEERIQVNGENIKKDELASIVSEIKGAISKVDVLKFGAPTQFEIITALMFYYFAKEKVDYAVIEVGLGGRLDATNIINPILVVLTSISFDHMNILGNTLKEIAGEKAGIIKKNCTVVSYPQEEEALEVIKSKCKELNNKLIVVKKESIKDVIINKDNFKQEIVIEVSKNTYDVKIPLLGSHQSLNCAVCLNAINALRNSGITIHDNSIRNGLLKVKWIGRMEPLKTNPLVVIDGAHNIDGIKKLRASIDKYFNYKNLILIVGILGDKQVNEMINIITRDAKNVIVTEPHNYRAESSSVLYEKIREKGIECFDIEDYEEAYKKALSLAKDDDLILVCGSLYMIGDMRKVIRNYK
ncbi:MAG: folylpolyglutamate synthase/dihydrofolate synthase family protein [Clostridium perfringens]|nr:folylpolyglutamate synthase/dihydrofolate synthase family protein [Clostridium perfringens]